MREILFVETLDSWALRPVGSTALARLKPSTVMGTLADWTAQRNRVFEVVLIDVDADARNEFQNFLDSAVSHCVLSDSASAEV